MTEVAVIIPAYNPGRYLRDTLASIVEQTFDDWEAVVIDDGSDEPLNWVEKVDSRIRRIRQSNLGLSAARNRGITATTAPLLAFLDADDLWLPTKLEMQVRELAARPDLGMLSTRFNIIDADGLSVGPGFEGHHDSYRALLTGNGVCVSTVIVRREMLRQIGDFDTRLAAVQDWDLWLRIAKIAQVDRLSESLTYYRVHAGGMSKDWRRTYLESREVLHRHDHTDVKEGLRHVRRLAAFQALDAAREAYHERDHVGLVRNLGFVGLLRPSLLARSVGQR